MFKTITGEFHPLLGDKVIIETDMGIGFEVALSSNSPLYKTREGDVVKVYTSTIIRENDLSLCGFSSLKELELFEQLITVNGVGPKAAMSIMGITTLDNLRLAIASGDAATISKAQGVGKKTAERVILDLRDKVGEVEDISASGDLEVMISTGREVDEAILALSGLGFTKGEATNAIKKIGKGDLKAEEYVRLALKELM